jgi:glyoxylate reductase
LLHSSGHDIHMNPHDQPWPRGQLLQAVAGCDGVLTQLHDTVDSQLMDAAGPGLRVISNFAVGYNNIDVAEASRRGIVVCNTPGVLTEATADIAWLLLIGVARRAAEGDRLMRTGRGWDWGPTFMLGADIVRKTLLIVGAGRIGQAVGRRARAWNMRILYVARRVHEDLETELSATRVDLEAGLRESDFVSLHVPLTAETKHLIDRQRLAMMKKSAYLINTSRGPVIDEAALAEALKAGTIAGAGLDVYEDEPRMAPGLADCPNTLLLPHLGSATAGTRAAMAETAARNLLAVLEGRDPPHRVQSSRVQGSKLDAPGVHLHRTNGLEP